MRITWKDKVRDEYIGKKTGLRKQERRLTRLGHLENGGFQNSSSGYTWGVDRLQEKVRAANENWMAVVKRDLKDMSITWEEAEELTEDSGGGTGGRGGTFAPGGTFQGAAF